MRTGAEYLASLDDGRRVWVGDERIDNVATHPKTRGYAQAVARFYDLHHERPDELTFVDEAGVRRSMMWFQPHDKEGLVRRRRYYETIQRSIGATAFHRLPDAGSALFLTYVDDPAPWEEQSVGTEGRGLARNIVDTFSLFAETDAFCSVLFVDPQTDRGSADAPARSPALRVVERNEQGIVVDGAKAVGTSSAFADWLHLGVFFRPGMVSEQIIFGVLPTNTPGVTLVARESAAMDDAANHPLASMGDELDNLALFDHVTIPWENVFHVGSVEHAMHYPQRVFDWHHYYILVRAKVRAELMAGLAMLMSESIGTWSIPEVKVRLAKFVELHTTVTAHVVAAEELGFPTPGGQYKPDMTQVDFGRAYFVKNLPEMVHELIDLCGRSALLYPSEGQWADEGLRRWLEPLNTGPTGKGYERVQIARVVHDLFLTEWGTRQQIFDNFQATPLRMIRFLSMMREFSPESPIVDFARTVCGIDLPAERADTTPDYVRRIDRASAASG